MSSYNRDSGLDFQLRVLGIEDRQNWEMISRDNRQYSNLLVVCRPDWALHNIITDEYRIVEYKSRSLNKGRVGRYERYEALINAVVVGDEISDRLDHDVTVTAYLVYGDGVSCEVKYTKEDGDFLMECASEIATDLFLQGKILKPGQVSSTRLAEALANRNDVDLEKRRAEGRRAHITLIKTGPQPRETHH